MNNSFQRDSNISKDYERYWVEDSLNFGSKTCKTLCFLTKLGCSTDKLISNARDLEGRSEFEDIDVL